MGNGRGRAAGAMLGLALALSLSAPAAARPPTVAIDANQPAGPTLMGLGVQWDPYDRFVPAQADWNLTFQRLDYMRPGFIRVVEPASDYFGGYDSHHNPRYRWTSRHVAQLLTILGYAKKRRITVVLGDWANPMINRDARVPAYFLRQLHDTYGYTNIRYYNLINEPNDQTRCDFGCWTAMVKTLSAEFRSLGLTRWLHLVGPDNSNSWDDTSSAYRLDTTAGLDIDNPLGGDSWVTKTLRGVPGLIGAYDSHRYGTIWGIEHGIYGGQMRARREQISNSGSAGKRYFAGEVGMTARQVSPFGAGDISRSALAAMIDPSALPSSGSFVDSQSHIREFRYGVWMADMMIQAIDGGVSGASAWDLDDAMHVGGQYGSQNLKQWGFWNSLGGRDGYPSSDRGLRPWYYSWSLLARSFPAGSRPLAAPNTGIAGVRIAAAKAQVGGRGALSLAIINDSDTARSIAVTVPSVRGSVRLARYDYFASDRPTDASGLPVPAAVLSVRLARGIRIDLPSRGLVVLSSLMPVGLDEGTRVLVDELNDWRKTESHAKGLTLDHGAPARFNDDRSRAVSTTGRPQALMYRVRHITSFGLKAYYKQALGLRAYRSRNGKTWTAIPLASSTPAPALGGHGRFLSELFPREVVPSGTNHLKILLFGRSTELAQVVMEYR